MKRVREILALTTVAAVFGVVPATTMAAAINPFAASGYSGPVVIKYTNFDEGTTYLEPNGTYGTHTASAADVTTLNGLAQIKVAPVAAQASSDGWGIFRIDTITSSDGTIDIYNRFTASYEITGIFWGLQDSYLKITDAGTAAEQQEIHSIGLHMAVFTDSSKNFSAQGPLGPNAVGSWTGGNPVFPTVTDGDLLWTLNSSQGFVTGDPDEFFSFFRPQSGGPGLASSNGGFLADTGAVPFWGVGAFNSVITNTLTNDAEINFTGDPVGANGFLLHSDDPIRLTVNGGGVPEPISAGLSLLGLAGLGLIASRRRTA